MSYKLHVSNLWINAAKTGSLHDIMSLHYHNFPGCTTQTMDYASMIGDMSILFFLYLNRNEGCSQQAFNYASAYGHFDVLNFLFLFYPEKCNINQSIINARCNNHKNIVVFLEEKQQEKLQEKLQEKIKKNKEKSSRIGKKRNRILSWNEPRNCENCNINITSLNCSSVKKRCKVCYNMNSKIKYHLKKKCSRSQSLCYKCNIPIKGKQTKYVNKYCNTCDYSNRINSNEILSCIDCKNIITLQSYYRHCKKKCLACYKNYKKNYYHTKNKLKTN